MKLTIEKTPLGTTVVYLTIKGKKVKTTRELFRDRDGTIVNLDLDERNEVLGVEVVGKVQVIDRRTANGHASKNR